MADPNVVPMFDPNGEVRMVPMDQVQAATEHGGKRAIPMADPQGTVRYVPHELMQDALAHGGKLVPVPSQPTQFEQDRQGVKPGWFSTAVGDLKGILTPSAQNPYPGMGTEQKVAAANQAAAEDDLRKQQGRSLAYRAVVPVAQSVGVNVPGIEQAADTGNNAAILGHSVAAAAPYVAPVVAGEAARLGKAGFKSVALQSPSPIDRVVNSPRGTVPAESATPSQLMEYAQQNNIPLNAAQATEHNFPRELQTVAERSPIGGTAVIRQEKAAQAATMEHATRLMDQMSPNTPDIATAGAKIKQNVESALADQQQVAKDNYAAVDKAADGVQVDLRPLKQQAAKILEGSNFLRKSVPTLDAKRAATILQAVVKAPDTASFSDAQALRSALLDETSHPENAISQQAQGWLKQMTGITDGQMMNAAGTTPALESAFREANDHWKQLQQDFNNPRSPFSQVLAEPDPAKVPQLFTQKGQIGGSTYRASLLDKYNIDRGPIKWAVLGDIAHKDFGLYAGGKDLGGYSTDFLNSIFTPDELGGVYKTGAIARSVRLNANPSGTAGSLSAIQDVQKPVRSMLPKGVAAKLTNDPAFNEWLMNGQNPADFGKLLRADYLRRQPRAITPTRLGVAASANDDQQ